MKTQNNNELKKQNLITIGNYLGLGTQLAATIIIMVFVGKFIDEKLNTYPYFLIIFSIFGSFAGMYNFIKTVLDLNKKEKKQNDK